MTGIREGEKELSLLGSKTEYRNDYARSLGGIHQQTSGE